MLLIIAEGTIKIVRQIRKRKTRMQVNCNIKMQREKWQSKIWQTLSPKFEILNNIKAPMTKI